MAEMVRLNVSVSQAHYEYVRDYAARRYIPIAEGIRNILDDYVQIKKNQLDEEALDKKLDKLADRILDGLLKS